MCDSNNLISRYCACCQIQAPAQDCAPQTSERTGIWANGPSSASRCLLGESVGVRAMRNEPPPAQSETFFPRNLHCDTMHSCPCLLGTTTFGRDIKRSHIASNGRIFKGYVRPFIPQVTQMKRKNKRAKGHGNFWASKYYYFSNLSFHNF